MQMNMRLRARRKTNEKTPVLTGKKLAVKAQRALNSVNSEYLKGFSGVVMQRAEAAQRAALSHQRSRKKPARIPMIALMTLMKRKSDARSSAQAPVWNPLLTKREVRGTLDSARQTLTQLELFQEGIRDG